VKLGAGDWRGAVVAGAVEGFGGIASFVQAVGRDHHAYAFDPGEHTGGEGALDARLHARAVEELTEELRLGAIGEGTEENPFDVCHGRSLPRSVAQARYNRDVPLGLGETFERCTIQEMIGRGGMGEVYCALDTRLLRKVALKVIRPDRTVDWTRRSRGCFHDDARADQYAFGVTAGRSRALRRDAAEPAATT
jgi:hypothetical protein